MSKRDVIDERMAQRFAWRTGEPEDATLEEPEHAPPPPAPAPPPDDNATKVSPEEMARWKRAWKLAAALAKDIALAWRMTERAPQAAATASLLQRAHRMDVELIAMRNHPMESLRLCQLVVRHWRRLPARVQKHAYALDYLSLPLSEREMAGLLVEVIASGDLTLAGIMKRSLEHENAGWRHPDIGTRLAHLVAEGKTWTARETAAEWLCAADLDVAAPALRRALRQPRLVLRTRALTLLLATTPPALKEDDVLFLLEDAVKHPLPRPLWREDERGTRYAEALSAAVTKVPPAEGWRPLEQIADQPKRPSRDRATYSYDREERLIDKIPGVDANWALRALAAAYPSRALGRIDRHLLSPLERFNDNTLEAVALLPPELARPRLLDVAARAHHRWAERAKAIWFERFGGACPVDPLRGVPVELLAEAPGERFFACLAVLRGSSDEARQKMCEALLAEAPVREPPPESLSAAQREAITLLCFAAPDARWPQSGLPFGAKDWILALRSRFGAPAFMGLAVLAEKEACAGLDGEFFSALADLPSKVELTEGERNRLCDIARMGLRSPCWDFAGAPLHAFWAMGAPADVEDRLWSILMAPEEAYDPGGRNFGAVWSTEKVLIRMRDAPDLDGRITKALVDAQKAGDWRSFERLAAVGCGRGVPPVFEEVRNAIAGYDGDPAAFEHIASAGWWLQEAGAVEEAWLLGVLRCPASPGFGIAAGLVGKQASLPVLDALQAALAVTARDGAAAAEAAEALFGIGALGAEDRRFDGILERAPARARASFADRLITGQAPLAPFHRHYIGLLASSEDGIADRVLGALGTRDPKPKGMEELLEDALPLVSRPEIRAAIEEALGDPSDDETYWRDTEGGADADDAGEEVA